MRWRFYEWIERCKFYVRQWMLPIIIIFFIRTLIFPTVIDVLILFILFLLYVGALFNWY